MRLLLITALVFGIVGLQREVPAPPTRGLFDGMTLFGWKPTKFAGGEGPVTVENGQIVLGTGSPMTGITHTGTPIPTTNYELAFEAKRVEGRDFFAGVTFPVEKSFCSLILGGWGGSTVGLSSIDGRDASENDTTQSIEFETDRWYAVRIWVRPSRIFVYLDDRLIINQDLTGKKVDIRLEVEASRPLGIATWRTKSALRNIKVRGPLPEV